MSSTSNSSKKTTSRFTCTELDSGNHTFEIEGYSLLRGTGVGRYFRSDTFTVGDFDWEIYFYPDGIEEASKDYVVALLRLVSSNSKAPARYVLRFVNHAPQMKMQTTLMLPIQAWPRIAAAESAQGAGLFRSCNGSCHGDGTRFGLYMLRSELEDRNNLSYYIFNDRLTIQCDLTVLGHSEMFQNRVEPKIEVPPSNMAEQFGNLLKHKKGVDVKFLVGKETFEAHKIVLAARSPVFWEEFLGPMSKSQSAGTCCVTVDDIEPAVFGAMLHFIYNDSLPDMGDVEGEDYGDMMWHLISAADRHGMDRLRLVCQSIICKNLDVETVATTLLLADQHNCGQLKDACIEFIASSENKDFVAATQGYANLKTKCPSVFIDLYERKSKLHNT